MDSVCRPVFLSLLWVCWLTLYVAVFIRLFHDWVYLPVWWNCQDFAVRLGYLVDPTVHSLQVLKSLLDRLKQSMVNEVIDKRDALINRVSISAWLGIIPCSLVSPPLAVACVGVFMMGGGAQVGGWELDQSRKKLSVSYMKNLESRFPKLQEFHR